MILQCNPLVTNARNKSLICCQHISLKPPFTSILKYSYRLEICTIIDGANRTAPICLPLAANCFGQHWHRHATSHFGIPKWSGQTRHKTTAGKVPPWQKSSPVGKLTDSY